MKALQQSNYGLTSELFQVVDLPKPVVPAGHVLIRVKAAALNPVDYMVAAGYVKFSPLPLCGGCDVAGVVEAVGAGVTRFAPGDRVASYTGITNEYSALAEYTIALESFPVRIPDNLPFERASTLGVASFTAVVGLFLGPGNPLPSKSVAGRQSEPSYCLIWGSSGSVGCYATQLAALAGFEVIGVSSPANFDLVRANGAKYVVDRNAQDAVEQIRKISGGKLRLVFDAVASEETTQKCGAALATEGEAHYSPVLPPKASLPGHVQVHNIVVGIDAVKHQDYFAEVADEFSALLASDKLKFNQVEKLSGGLNGVPAGLQALQKGAVSAKKLVVVIDETA